MTGEVLGHLPWVFLLGSPDSTFMTLMGVKVRAEKTRAMRQVWPDAPLSSASSKRTTSTSFVVSSGGPTEPIVNWDTSWFEIASGVFE